MPEAFRADQERIAAMAAAPVIVNTDDVLDDEPALSDEFVEDDEFAEPVR
jgi:hypothetical protein